MPAFEFSRLGQSLLGLGIELVVKCLGVYFQSLFQSRCNGCGGFAMALQEFGLKLLQQFLHSLLSLFPQGRVNRCTRGRSRSRFDRFAA